jgi:hypothetical protein
MGCHRKKLLVIGVLSAAACSTEPTVQEGQFPSGFAGMSSSPAAGTIAPAPVAGTSAPPQTPVAGTVAPQPMAGNGAAGDGVAGDGAAGDGFAGDGAAGDGAAGDGAAGDGAAGDGVAGTGAAGAGPIDSGESSCLDGITDFGARGPFQYRAAHQGSVKIWVPMTPAGCKVPVVHLANGTGASCSAYQNVLNSLASHGFLTTCYESTNTGAGTQGVMAIETVFNRHADMAAKRIGSTGHSQGGQAAFTVLQQAEDKWGDSYVYAGLAMQPASGFGSQPRIRWQQMYGMIKSPMFMFNGTSDTLVSQSWVAQGFTALSRSIEAYHWSARGSTHIPTPQAETIEVAIPWFRWKLLGDRAACMAFKALPSGMRWTVIREQNVAPCP